MDMRFVRNIDFAQAKNTRIYVQFWSWGIFIGHRPETLFRLELLTPSRWFAIRVGRWHKTIRVKTLNPHYLRETWRGRQ
jgi:hypothetical protein